MARGFGVRFSYSVALNLGVIRQTRSCMTLVLVAAFLVGVFLFSHYPRWLGRVPRHVHAIALAVGVIAGSILWRAGALPVLLAARLAIFVIPVAAVYYFYFQTGESSRAPGPRNASSDARSPLDPDV